MRYLGPQGSLAEESLTASRSLSHLVSLDEPVHVSDVDVLTATDPHTGEVPAPDHLSDGMGRDPKVVSDGLDVIEASGQGRGFRGTRRG